MIEDIIKDLNKASQALTEATTENLQAGMDAEKEANTLLVVCEEDPEIDEELELVETQIRDLNTIPTEDFKMDVNNKITRSRHYIKKLRQTGRSAAQKTKTFVETSKKQANQVTKTLEEIARATEYDTTFKEFMTILQDYSEDSRLVTDKEMYSKLNYILREYIKPKGFGKRGNKCIWCFCCWKIITFDYTRKEIPRFEGTQIPKGISLESKYTEFKKILELIIKNPPTGSSLQIQKGVGAPAPRIAFLAGRQPNHMCYLSIEVNQLVPHAAPVQATIEETTQVKPTQQQTEIINENTQEAQRYSLVSTSTSKIEEEKPEGTRKVYSQENEYLDDYEPEELELQGKRSTKKGRNPLNYVGKEKGRDSKGCYIDYIQEYKDPHAIYIPRTEEGCLILRKYLKRSMKRRQDTRASQNDQGEDGSDGDDEDDNDNKKNNDDHPDKNQLVSFKKKSYATKSINARQTKKSSEGSTVAGTQDSSRNIPK